MTDDQQTMKRILFVDDEPSVLSGLKRMLRGMRKEWDMTFCDRGRAALEAMEAQAFDVVVSDMRMPEMDGATLLKQIQEKYPGTVRIILSGHSEMEAALRAVPVAHQFLSKPCDSDVLRAVVTRACGLEALLANPAVQRTIGGLDSLPSVPRVYNELTQALADPEVSLDDVAAIVEQDVGITVKVLQVVNSSFFGIAKTVEGIRQATSYLGTTMIRQLALSVEVFHTFQHRLPAECSLEEEQEHATLTARIARHLLDTKEASEKAFLAAMVHDIGKLILATSMPALFTQVMEAKKSSDSPLWAVEKTVYGVSHAELGAYLLGIWGLPYPIVEAVAHHHEPSRVDATKFDLVGAVHVANGLAHELLAGEDAEPFPFDMVHLEAVGAAQRVPEWRAMARAEVETAKEEAA